MAILKDLIVHGSSRFLNKIYASEIQTPLIDAEAGIFKKLKADDATVVGLLDIQGQMHTNNWSNSNIATIDGSFYITPTIGSDSGTVTITATSLNFSGTNYAVTSLYLGDNSSITWPQYSKVLVTGQILSNGEWIPLGTLLGQLSAQAAAASIKINNIKDNKNQTSSVLVTFVNNGTTSSSYRNLKVSLYQRASSSTAFYPLGIYITATGDNGRTFLDIYGGVESLENNANHGGFAEPNVRIGNLQGLPNVGGQSPNGWGIYTDNGYFKGIIAADRGYIGTGSKYWVIGNYEDGSNSDNDRSYIYNGTNSTTSTIEGVYLGTDGIRNYKDSTHYVTIKNGVISALGVDLSGKITASSGFIGGWNIGTDTNKSLYHGNQTPGATTTNLVLSPTSATNSNAIGGSATGLNWFLSAGKVFGVTTAGALYATSGKIGSWEIGSNYLLTGTWGTGESALLSTGSSSSKKIGGSDLINNWVFTAGANFGVTKSGALYASSANISGKITATSGEIGGITIDNNGKLWITDANISGTISGNHIDASSISIGNLNGASNYAQKTDVTQAIDNIEVGGRNLLKEFDCLAPVQTSKGITITYNGNGWFNVNGTVTGTSAGILCFYGSSQYTSNISGSGEYTLSIETNGTIFLPSNKTFIQLAYHSDNATDNKIAGEFHILSGSTKVTFTIPGNHHISRVCLFIQANATDSVVDGNIRLKLERGNKATDWTPAPEDVVNEAVNKVEVGGRNLIRNSTNFNKWVVKKDGANGDIWSRSVSGNTSNVNLRPRTWIGTGNLADYYNKTLTISFEIMSPDWSAIEEGTSNTGLNALVIQLETVNGTPYSSSIGSTGRYFFKRLGDKNYFKTDSDLVDGEWVKITSVPLKIDDTLWNNSTTLIDGYDYFTFSFILRRNGTISFRKPQIEIGNKATDWTPAPEDIENEINNAGATATDYITYIDAQNGIRVHNSQDIINYLQLNSSAISMYRNDIETLNISNNEIRVGKFSDNNVFIDNDSIDIRKGTTTLASFTGDNTKFYDPIYDKELATFGASGAIIGANNEQRFIIEKDGIKSINNSGATVFSVNSTEGTVVTEAEVAPSGETGWVFPTSVTLDTVGSGSSVGVTFYNKSMTAIIAIDYCNSNLTNVKVNSVSSSATQIPTPLVYSNMSAYSIALPPFTFIHGTAQTTTYTITASFVNTFGDSYNLTAVETVTYDGAITIELSPLSSKCVRTSGNHEEESKVFGLWSKVVYGEIYQSSAYTKAPAMTFGTRGKNAIMAPFSVTIGKDLYANNDNQLSIGKYNINNDEFFPLAFAIGNGTSDNDRSNAFNVDWDGNVEIAGDLEVTGNLMANNFGGNYLPFGRNINNLSKYDTGWWGYARSEVDGTFPVSDTYGTICHIQGTSDNVAIQFLRSNTQGATNPILYTRYKIGGTWGAWQRYVSANTTYLTITRINNNYCTQQDISFLLAYKKGGFLSLLGNLHVSNGTTSNVSETDIATISGWNGIPATMTLPGQWSPSGSRPLFVSVRANGLISIGAYSGLLAADWYRFFLTVPCSDGYE